MNFNELGHKAVTIVSAITLVILTIGLVAEKLSGQCLFGGCW